MSSETERLWQQLMTGEDERSQKVTADDINRQTWGRLASLARQDSGS